MYYDRNGNRIEMMKYCKLFSDKSYQILKQEILPNGDKVSTVWLGIDHSFALDEFHKPIIFETMIFSDNQEYDTYCERYSTEEEAMEGHKRFVEKYSKGVICATEKEGNTV